MSIFYLLYSAPILLIGGIGGIIFAMRHHKKIPSPEESEEAFTQLKKEVAKWQEEGIIEQSQGEKIIERYSALKPKRELAKREKIVKLFSLFGAILVGVGVILLIATNWRKIPPFVHTLLLISATAGVYFAGWRFKYEKRTHPKIGESLIFLGSLLFGASLILIAQLYHIRIEYSYLILVWALGVLPLALITKSFPVSALSSILILCWGIFSLREGTLGEGTFPLQYYLSLLFILALAVPLSYRLKSLSVQGLNMLEILVWLGPMAALKWFRESANPIVDICLLFLAVGLAVFLLGELHSRSKKYRSFKEVYYPFGLVVIFLASFLLTFPQLYEIGFRSLENVSFMPVFFNFVLFGEICGAIYLGIRKEENSFINLGVLFFGLLVVARYFSLAWSLGSRAFVFIGGGILLIVGSYFIDKARRKLLRKAKPR